MSHTMSIKWVTLVVGLVALVVSPVEGLDVEPPVCEKVYVADQAADGNLPVLDVDAEIVSLQGCTEKMLRIENYDIKNITEFSSTNFSEVYLFNNAIEIPLAHYENVLPAPWNTLEVNRNRLFGQIPASFFLNRRSLVKLSLRSNLLNGKITGLEQLESLQSVDLALNRLSGTIPLPPNIRTVRLEHNKFTGIAAKNLGSLKTMVLNNNKITPDGLRALQSATNLETLSLRENSLSREALVIINGLQQLTSLDISGNMIGGEFPTELFTLLNLETLVIENNGFVGTIPFDITRKFKSLQTLNLVNGNSFERMTDAEEVAILLSNGIELPEAVEAGSTDLHMASYVALLCSILLGIVGVVFVRVFPLHTFKDPDHTSLNPRFSRKQGAAAPTR